MFVLNECLGTQLVTAGGLTVPLQRVRSTIPLIRTATNAHFGIQSSHEDLYDLADDLPRLLAFPARQRLIITLPQSAPAVSACSSAELDEWASEQRSARPISLVSPVRLLDEPSWRLSPEWSSLPTEPLLQVIGECPRRSVRSQARASLRMTSIDIQGRQGPIDLSAEFEGVSSAWAKIKGIAFPRFWWDTSHISTENFGATWVQARISVEGSLVGHAAALTRNGKAQYSFLHWNEDAARLRGTAALMCGLLAACEAAGSRSVDLGASLEQGSEDNSTLDWKMGFASERQHVPGVLLARSFLPRR
jgi:hypothetical protein